LRARLDALDQQLLLPADQPRGMFPAVHVDRDAALELQHDIGLARGGAARVATLAGEERGEGTPFESGFGRQPELVEKGGRQVDE
jgi:hypothetical protein